jgi:hypothetical protein
MLRCVRWQFCADASGQPIRPVCKGQAVRDARCLTFQKSEGLNSKPDKQCLLLIPGFSSKRGKVMLFYRDREEGSIRLSESLVAIH